MKNVIVLLIAVVAWVAAAGAPGAVAQVSGADIQRASSAIMNAGKRASQVAPFGNRSRERRHAV